MNDRARHRTTLHIGRLIFGVCFIVMGVFGVVDANFSTTWVWVGILAAAGVAGLVTTLRSLFTQS